MLTLNMLIQEETPNYLGIVWPKGTFEKLIERLNKQDARICVYERLSSEENVDKNGNKVTPERGDVIGTICDARQNGNFVECDIEFVSKYEWMKATFNKEEFSLNSEIEADLNDDNTVKLKTVCLRAISIVETDPKGKITNVQQLGKQRTR